MTRGRKPKPTAKKRLEGNPGKRKINKREPLPKASEVIEAQAITDGAQAFIDKYKPQLHAMQILTDVDVAALELMATHYSIAWESARVIQKQGLTVTDTFKQVHKHPLLSVFRDNSTAYRAYAAEFGMTPSSRSRIQVPEPAEWDQLEMELFGQGATVVSGSEDE